VGSGFEHAPKTVHDANRTKRGSDGEAPCNTVRLAAWKVADRKTPMLIDAPQTRHCLQRLVSRLTPQSLWHEDLVQEGLVHLWQEARRCPGQSDLWYLRSCQFHLQNCLRHGHSIDSLKRRNGSAMALNGHSAPEDGLEALPDPATDASVCEVVMARDLLAALLRWLTPAERKILACLLEGLSMRETARRLKLSHTCVENKRRRIADSLVELTADALPHTSGSNRLRGCR
jgi:DNA-directed RNA polymerase specialized sigma24 family protein